MQQLHTKGRRKTKDWKFNWNQSAYSHVWSSTQTHTHTHTTASCAPLHVPKYATISTNLWNGPSRFWPTFKEFHFSLFCMQNKELYTFFLMIHTHQNYSLLHIWPLNLTRNKYSMSGPKGQSQVLVSLRASACGTGPSRLTQHLVVGLSEPIPVDFWFYTHKTMSSNRHIQINLSITTQICILK